MPDFLLELRCEEIPARMQAGARADLENLFLKQLAAADVACDSVQVWSTPRRLALIARELPAGTRDSFEDIKGPRVGAPTQALEGFLRKNGLTENDLVQSDGVWLARRHKAGRAVREVLAEAIPAIVRAFPWPKSMRWGAASLSTESLRWVRPLSGMVVILGEELVECEVGGVRSGFATLGHRFHHPGEITIGSAADYQDKLRACHVIVDHEERQDIVRVRASEAASAAGLTLVEDEGLVIENAGLTEWPVPLLGRFDEAYLDVPPEVIQLTARVNQKYFVCENAQGKLANAFVCTANIEAVDGGEAIVAGNRKVLAARLSDARFFWEQDLKTPLAEQAKKLERITFHEKLGTVADKVDRVAKLARWLCEEGIVTEFPLPGGEGPRVGVPTSQTPNTPTQTSPSRGRASLADLAQQAARLCKADLVTEMVGEFPELQGLMGGYYARAEGLPVEVSDAIRDHYKPVGQGDDVPTAPVTVAVSLADKLDTFLAFFDIKEYPTGSKDPFALRRATIAIIRLILDNQLIVHTDAIIECWLGQTDPKQQLEPTQIARRSLLTIAPNFLLERLKVQLRDAGVRHDFVEASQRWQARDDGRLDRAVKRASALQAFIGTEDGANLLAGYKRAANILKKEGYENPPRNGEGDRSPQASGGGVADSSAADPSVTAADTAAPPPRPGEELAKSLPYTPEPAEKALIDALTEAGPKAESAVAAEDFAGAMAALASLRSPIDAFFEAVTVNDRDPAKRAARLELLDAFRAAVHNVADFSKIEG